MKLLMMGFLLLLFSHFPAWCEVQECTPVSARADGKITCRPVTPSGPRPATELPSSSQQRQMFTGRVTKVLDNHTFVVDREGTPIQVRINRDKDSETASLGSVALNREAKVYIRSSDGERQVYADVLLPSGENILNVAPPSQATREKIRRAQEERDKNKAASEAQAKAAQEAQERGATEESARRQTEVSLAPPSTAWQK